MPGILKVLVGYGIVFTASFIIWSFAPILGAFCFVFGGVIVTIYAGYVYMFWLKKHGLY